MARRIRPTKFPSPVHQRVWERLTRLLGEEGAADFFVLAHQLLRLMQEVIEVEDCCLTFERVISLNHLVDLAAEDFYQRRSNLADEISVAGIDGGEEHFSFIGKACALLLTG